jgi:HPr kinase/phosphorylase
LTILHATCVAIGGRGVLLTGPSGSGKSDLALRLIDRGALLVSDDGVAIRRSDDGLFASAPATIIGKMEVRGLGIVTLPYVAQAPVVLAVALDATPERMPPESLPTREIEGVAVPVLALLPFEHSAPIKVERALALWGIA